MLIVVVAITVIMKKAQHEINLTNTLYYEEILTKMWKKMTLCLFKFILGYYLTGLTKNHLVLLDECTFDLLFTIY